MSWSIKLFSVKGIDVKVHFTFLLILLWAAYRWSGSTGAGVQGALFGIVVTLLLFVSVTLHEFGHSLQAIRYGVRVRDITLMPMGGLSRMDEIPEKPRQELRIALAGPLVNFVIAAFLVVVGLVLSRQAIVTLPELLASLGQASWAGMLAYLTMTNLALGLFNLIPAFPMDGGRVLRALLALKLNYARATAIAVAIGQALAFLLGLWGFSQADFFLMLIAFFVWMGAEGEGKQVQAKNVLRDLRARQAMSRQPQTVSADDSLAKAAELVLSGFEADFPVVQDGQVIGLLTEGDLLNGLKVKGATATVEQVMQKNFMSAAPDDSLYQLQQRMTQSRVSAVPVMTKDGRLVGMLTATDINEAYRLLSVDPGLATEKV